MVVSQMVGDTRMELIKVVKLAFIADLMARNAPGRTTTVSGMGYVAERFGPVPAREGLKVDVPQLLSSYCEKIGVEVTFEENHVCFGRPPHVSMLDTDALVFARQAVEAYGQRSGSELSDITHEFPAWFMTPIGDLISDDLMAIPYRMGAPEALD